MVTGTRSLDGQRSDGPLQLHSSAAGVQTDHLGHPGSEALPHFLHPRPLRTQTPAVGMNQQPLHRRKHRQEESPAYLNALRLGRPADGERRGGVGPEDVGA